MTISSESWFSRLAGSRISAAVASATSDTTDNRSVHRSNRSETGSQGPSKTFVEWINDL